MNTQNKRLSRVCFTGHRPETIGRSEFEIKELLRPVIIKSVNEGFRTFITGMARGFDLWAADIVLEYRESLSDIHLVCALPMPNFEKKWNIREQNHYRDILAKADHAVLVSEHYSKACFQKRNIYMVDRAARVIAAYNGGVGGTYNTISYAKKKNVEVINIL